INKEAFKRYEKAGTWLYDIEELGYKYNFDDIHASLGLVQLRRLDGMLARRREIARMYRQALEGVVDFSADSSEHFHTYHLFLARLMKDSLNRDDIIQELKSNNVGASVHYIPLHLHSYYKKRFAQEDFPVANRVFKSIFSIPMFSAMRDSDVEYVIQQLKAIILRRKL
ncbi:MAG: DegT/DnrJ/EryC1/StrS family aminotransferase, partial [Candidatus Omnitrophica bacterium]|nr:DegT/DnrJ/EryC1/StrS family aminotransferase [Candidatus Omnitrophota bacterium]